MRPYMVFSDTPPAGYSSDDELLVSITQGDVIEAYSEWESDLDKAPEDWPYAWNLLSSSRKRDILIAVGDANVDLYSIFDGVLM